MFENDDGAVEDVQSSDEEDNEELNQSSQNQLICYLVTGDNTIRKYNFTTNECCESQEIT